MGTEITRYADKAMFEAEPVDEQAVERPRVYLLSATPDPLGAVAAMSMMYEGRVVRDLGEITDDERSHYFRESFKTHLKAPWESIDLHFMIEGVTRAFTHQMVRQRTAVFAQESMRFAVKEGLMDAVRPGPLIQADRAKRNAYFAAVERIEEAYMHLIRNGIPAEEARGLLPHDTLTRLHYKTNLRNLAEHLGNRLCTQAQFEWRLVAADLKRALGEHGRRCLYNMTDDSGHGVGESRSHWQFRLLADSEIFQPICFTTGKCEFRSAADRGCTIRERVDNGEFAKIAPVEWLADPTAGWVR